MNALPISLPIELRNARDAQNGKPLHLLDNESQKVYVVIEQPTLNPIDDAYIRRALREALEDEARGDVGPWDVEEIQREGRRILSQRRAQRNE